MDKKGGLNIKCYSSAYQLQFERSIPYLSKDQILFNVAGTFEVKKQLVFLIEFLINKEIPVLSRLIIDMNDGSVIETEELSRQAKLSLQKIAIEFATEDKPTPNFYARKAVNSDAYAVVYSNTASKNNAERIDVMHFNDNNKIINRSFLKTSEPDRKELSPIIPCQCPILVYLITLMTLVL